MAEKQNKKTNPLVDSDIQTTAEESLEYKEQNGKKEKSGN